MQKGSRRHFMVGAAKAGVVAGTALWVAPRMSSVALAQELAGSPPPEDPEDPEDREEVLDEEVSGTPEDPPETEVAGRTATQEDATDQRGGSLPVTGVDSRTLTIAGGTAIAAGGALLAAREPLREAPAGDGHTD